MNTSLPFRQGSVLVILLLAVMSAFGQVEDAKQLAVVVRAQLEASNPEGAAAALDRLEKLRGTQPPDYEMLFLQGVTWQQLASSGKSVDRAQAIERSKQAYLDALKLRPQAPAIFNNLGSLYTLAGDETTADDWYRKAVAADDKRRGYYALNYARALEKRDQKEALRYAQMALKASPDNDEVRAYVGALARSAGSGDEFLQFLVDSAYKGHTKVVTSLALQDLTSDVPRPEAGKSHVLAVLAFALTRDRTALAQQPAPQLIDDLKRVVDTDASIGAQQLVRVLSAPPSTASELGWWNRDRVRALDRSRAAVMRELLISLGLQRTQKDPQDGERLLMSAIELGDRGPDPDAFLRLVELYVNQGQTSRLQELMRRYEVELFSEKGEAYQRNDMQLVYRMHLALGMTYAYMNVWSSPSPFQNATFQLENAGRAAERFNEQARRSGKTERLVMPPAAVLKLSEAYATAGQRDRATQLRIDSADALSTARRTADSVEVFRTIQKEDVARLGVASKEKYRALDAANK